MSAINAHLTTADNNFIDQYLDPQEKFFFYNTDLPTQKHAVQVARKCLELAQEHNINPLLLTKAGLLHDIGKTNGDLTIINKSLIVLGDKLCPSLLLKLAQKEKSPFRKFRHALYIYYNHPAIGAELLQKHSLESELINLIFCHHQPVNEDTTRELRLLKQADNMF